MENLVDLGRLKSRLEQERRAIDEKLHAIALVEQMLASETAQVETQVASNVFSEKPIKEACVDVVNASERDLTTADVLDLLLRGGAKFTTDRPVNTVAATLNRLAGSGRIGSRKKRGRVFYFKKDRTQLLGRGGRTDTNHQDMNYAQRLESAPMLGIQRDSTKGPTRPQRPSRRAHILQFSALHPEGSTINELVRELQSAGWDTNAKKVRSLVWRLKDEGRMDTLEPGCFVVAGNRQEIRDTLNSSDLLELGQEPLHQPISLEETQEREEIGQYRQLTHQTE